jgi:hypothetical protein
MKCNKCGTPIISGETRCRFCGKTVVIKKPEVINEPEKTIKKPEVIKEAELIIDAPKKEVKPIIKTKTEIIDMPKKVSVESEKKVVASKPKSSEMIIDTPKAKKEPEVIMDTPKAKKESEVIMDVPKAKKEPEVIIETPKKELKPIIKTNNEIIDIPKKENNVKVVVKEEKNVQRKEIDVVDELEKTAKLERINLEEFTGKIDKEEIHNLIIEEKKKEEKNEEKEIKKDTKLIVEKAFHEKANNFMVLGILVCVLALSLTFNGYLYINRNKLSKNISKGVSKNTKIVYHDN